MRVAVFNAWCNGSTGKIIGEIAKAGQKYGIESFLFYGRGENPYIEKSYNINTKVNLYVDALKSRILDNQGCNSIITTRKAIRMLKKFKPDIIHLHNLHGYWLNYPALFMYIKRNNIPVVWTLHDCWALTGHCAYFEYLECKNRIKGCVDCPGTKNYPKAFFDRAAYSLELKREYINQVDRMIIVSPSQWLANMASDSILSKYPIRVINNEISAEIFHFREYEFLYEKYNICKDKKTILYVAMNTNDPWKGFGYITSLHKILPGRYQIVVVGNCDVQSKDGFINIGRTENQDELAAFYSLADVLVNTSLDDNYPTVNIEALACGLPIVAFRTGGIPEQVNDDVGYICVEKSVEQLLEGIERICSKNRDVLREKCINHFRNSFERGFAKKYIKIYQEVIAD